MDGSLTRSAEPPPAYLVMPGSRPLVHVLPLSVDVAKPIVQAPPSKMRPTWNTATIVEPLEKVSGSTSVWWLVVADAAHVACVNGSVLSTSGTAADAAGAEARIPPTTAVAATADMAIFRLAVLGARCVMGPSSPAAGVWLLLASEPIRAAVFRRRFGPSPRAGPADRPDPLDRCQHTHDRRPCKCGCWVSASVGCVGRRRSAAAPAGPRNRRTPRSSRPAGRGRANGGAARGNVPARRGPWVKQRAHHHICRVVRLPLHTPPLVPNPLLPNCPERTGMSAGP